ncbi:MAG: hypothetical protein SFZ23_11955 [Planctomycetota bacterium]|nr:hypothetical protein [Planctomycetota bacterium]
MAREPGPPAEQDAGGSSKATLEARLVSFAGELAERGITELELHIAGEPVRLLHARETDLPGMLRDAMTRAANHAVDRAADRVHRPGPADARTGTLENPQPFEVVLIAPRAESLPRAWKLSPRDLIPVP